VIASGLIAIARATPPSHGAPVAALVRRSLEDPRANVRDAALLALGILGDREALAPLGAVLHDRDDGRRLTHELGGVSCARRQLAALALGLLGGDDAAGMLLRAAERPACSDLLAAALVGAAKAAPDSTAVAARAITVLRGPGGDAAARGHAAIALSRLAGSAGRAALPLLVELARDAGSPPDVRTSAVVALGALATIEDGEAAAGLLARTRDGGDPRPRELAYVAIGRVLERDPAATRSDARRRPLVARLLDQALHPDRRSDRPWALLGLGLALRDDAPDGELRGLVASKLRTLVAQRPDPTTLPAAALALGLMRDRAAIERLAGELAARPPAEVQSFLVQALGLTRDRAAVDAVRTTAFAAGTAPAVRIEAARALALLHDAGALARCERQLAEADGSEAVAASLQALGALRTLDAMAPLAALLSARPRPPAPTRAQAAVALGALGDPLPAPWWSAYSKDANLHLRAPTLLALLPE